jgi:hypothetical protein
MPKRTDIKFIVIIGPASELGATTNGLDLRGQSVWMTNARNNESYRSLPKLA